MKIFDSINNFPEFLGSAVTIGNFDGVHLGHKFVIENLIFEAKSKRLKSTLVTFDIHPRIFFNPNAHFKLITELPEKVELLSKFEIDNLVILPFDEVSEWPARYFLDFLLNQLKMKLLIVGSDFRFGKDRLGNVDLLKSLSSELGFELKLLSKFSLEGVEISSSLIRGYLEQKNYSKIESLLGRKAY